MPNTRTRLLTNLPTVTSPNGKLVGVEGEKIFRRLQSSIAYSTWRKCLTQKVGLKEGEDFFWRHERRSGRSEKCFYLTKDALRRIPEDFLMRRSDKQEAKRGKRKTKEAPREVSPAEFLEGLLPGFVLPEDLPLSVAVRQDPLGWAIYAKALHLYLGLKSGCDGWKRNQIRKHSFVEGDEYFSQSGVPGFPRAVIFYFREPAARLVLKTEEARVAKRRAPNIPPEKVERLRPTLPVREILLGGRIQPTVSARDLHASLGRTIRFNPWMLDRRRNWAANRDYLQTRVPGGSEESPRHVKDFQLSFPMARQILSLGKEGKDATRRTALLLLLDQYEAEHSASNLDTVLPAEAPVEECAVIDGRLLHEACGIGIRYSMWAYRRVERMGLVEGKDYRMRTEVAQGGTPHHEYFFSAEAAEEILFRSRSKGHTRQDAKNAVDVLRFKSHPDKKEETSSGSDLDTPGDFCFY